MTKCYKCGSGKVWQGSEDSLHLSICEECMKETSQKEFDEIFEKIKKEPIIKITEIDDKELKEILENNDVIEVREDNLNEVFKKIEKLFEDK